jgi:hypothetical protein
MIITFIIQNDCFQIRSKYKQITYTVWSISIQYYSMVYLNKVLQYDQFPIYSIPVWSISYTYISNINFTNFRGNRGTLMISPFFFSSLPVLLCLQYKRQQSHVTRRPCQMSVTVKNALLSKSRFLSVSSFYLFYFLGSRTIKTFKKRGRGSSRETAADVERG